MTIPSDTVTLDRISNLLDSAGYANPEVLLAFIATKVRATGRTAGGGQEPTATGLTLDDNINALGLSTRATNVLRRLGADTISQAVSLDEQSLWDFRNVGPVTVSQILRALAPYQPDPELDEAAA